MIIVTAENKCRRAGIDFKKGKNEFKQLSAANLRKSMPTAACREHIKEKEDAEK